MKGVIMVHDIDDEIEMDRYGYDVNRNMVSIA